MTRYKLRGTESDRTGDVHLWITRDDQPLDLEEIVEDLMWQQREIERLRGELDECRRLLREAIAACEGYLPVVPDDQTRVALLTLEWYEAALAAGGGEES
jgi:hypothetical protein